MNVMLIKQAKAGRLRGPWQSLLRILSKLLPGKQVIQFAEMKNSYQHRFKSKINTRKAETIANTLGQLLAGCTRTQTFSLTLPTTCLPLTNASNPTRRLWNHAGICT
jgi:hypothetical protein